MKICEPFLSKPLEKLTFSKIINERHYQRLLDLIIKDKIVIGGNSNPKTNKLNQLFLIVTWNDRVMQEEIFGPILPIIVYDDLKEALKQVEARPKPLALYLFTTSKQVEEYVLRNISYGGGCVNDTIVHLATSYLPFGGVGASGMGSYHGRASFDTFSHKKSIMKKSNNLDIPLRYLL